MENAYFRIGKSAYLLGKYQDAFENFTTYLKCAEFRSGM